MKKYLVVLFFIACCSTTCNTTDDFYTYSQIEDLWRLPLIKPYELINLKNSDPTFPDPNGWEIDFDKKNETGGELFSRVNLINVKRKLIYGYGKGLVEYFVIDTRIKKEYFFENKNDWNAFLDEHSIDTSSLLNVWDTFYEFHENHTLPWKAEIDSLRR
jgi:hypothetical protein